MRPLNLIYALLVYFLMSSCEKSFELKMGDTTNPGNGSGNGGAGAPAGAMIKIEHNKTSGLSTQDYEYDANGRFIKLTVSNFTTTGAKMVRRFVRDNTGRVIKVISNASMSSQGQQPIINNTDSIIINVHYPSATSVEFDYTTSVQTIQGMALVDSTVFIYNGGRITEMNSYYGMNGLMAALVTQTKYTYDANGNVAKQEIYTPDATGTGKMELILTYTVTYDDKNSPLVLGNESMIGGGDFQGAAKNNMTKMVIDITNPLMPASSQTTTITYQYGASNKPATAAVSNPVDGNYNSTFYYK